MKRGLQGRNMNVDDVIREAAALCRRFHAKKVILYGSRAKGTAQERSDIDIAVTGVTDFERLLEEVDGMPTLYRVDVLNLDACRNELLLEDIKEYGQEI